MTLLNLRNKSVSAGLRVLRDLGFVTRAASSGRRNSSLLILCYHGLSLQDEHEWAPHLYLRPEIFRSRLACLQRMDASVLPLSEALERLRTNSLPPRSVVITFDDGFHDFLRHGVPVLSEFGYPATLYLTTYYCNYKLPIIDLALGYVLWKSGCSRVELPNYGLESAASIETYDERLTVTRKVLNWAERNHLDTVAKNALARELASKLAVDYDKIMQRRLFQLLSPEEVGEVARAGVDIQLHTHRHRTPRDRTLFVREIEDNRDRIRDMTGANPVHFCYPSGDYAAEFVGWLGECGVRTAATCETGLARCSSESMKLPRVLDVNNMDPIRFESIVAGLLV